ncbi:MAG: transcription antitermination factor NusB [Ignavibacteria bacterium]|nr:transcription antitermination factor NusB [Ignavibacteria bacterium]
MTSTRRQLREKVLQILYAHELSNESLDFLFKELTQDVDSEDTINFIKSLTLRTIEHTAEFDELIIDTAKNWDINRIAVIDKILIRMGICEMLYFPDIPTKVSINEVLEIAKRFSTDHSDKFINGVLDAILKRLKNQNKISKKGRGLVENNINPKN